MPTTGAHDLPPPATSSWAYAVVRGSGCVFPSKLQVDGYFGLSVSVCCAPVKLLETDFLHLSTKSMLVRDYGCRLCECMFSVQVSLPLYWPIKC